MSEIILSVNAGSSSVKMSVYAPPADPRDDPVLIAEASMEDLTTPPAKLKQGRGDEEIKERKIRDIGSQQDAFAFILDHFLEDKGLSELSRKEDIKFVCHRIVHGGDYPKSQIIGKETFRYIEELSVLAPLHNAPALSIVRAASDLLPDATHVAYFDSAFHATIPKHISTYPIDQAVAGRNKLRKYGFHGISYSFILRAVSAHLGKPKDRVSIVALHLGSGASASCIRNGASLDTSMGLTPLEGLPGATRSGSVDPSLVFRFLHGAGKPSHPGAGDMSITRAEEILNKNSGWKSLTGTSDFRQVGSSDAERHKLAFDIFVDRILNYVPSYFAKLDGEVDALVFSGGIGEHGAKLRRAVVDGVRCLGFELNEAKNSEPGNQVVTDISARGAKYKTLICKTNEQLEMARSLLEERDK